MTLIELLLVISVSVLLLAVAVPLLRIPLQGRKAREASRQIGAIIARAKAVAAETNRAAGVLFRRADANLPGGPYYAFQISVVETPPPYMGDDAAALATIAPNSFVANLTGSSLMPYLVVPGDMIRFDYKGPYYRIAQITPDPNDPTLTNVAFTDPFNPGGPPPVPVAGVPYQVFRSPQSLANSVGAVSSLRPPLELPNGIVVDLSVSGVGAGLRQFALTPEGEPAAMTDVLVMFEPDGSVQRVYHNTNVVSHPSPPPQQLAIWEGIVPQDSIFLLVGRLEQVSPADIFLVSQDVTANLMDENSIWVAINHKTGKVTAAENSTLVGSLPQPVPPAMVPSLIAQAREFARVSQDMGGR